MTDKPKLAFVSPVFLFPNDTGGKIRTTNILKGLKDGAFHVTLAMPADERQRTEWSESLTSVCDRLVAWRPAAKRAPWQRALRLLDPLPINVVADRTPAAMAAVRALLARESFDLVVYDFVHSTVLQPERGAAPHATVCFTHNVEAEIFQRHAAQSHSPLMRRVWASQHRKMWHFERNALRRFDTVVAVSQRDADQFHERYGVSNVEVIPTGVDLDYFDWREPPSVSRDTPPTVVFTGSMDWAANIDGVQFFLTHVWPLVLSQLPEARFVVVGRHPPASLIQQARGLSSVTLTGYVDDVRPHVHAAHAFAIPLRVGGGTRIKAFEAMAMGCPIVSTPIGIEGLDVDAGEHFLQGESPEQLAHGIVRLLRDDGLRRAVSRRARHCVEQRFGHRMAAEAFEVACLRSIHASRASSDSGTALLHS